ncbi:MAG: RrF2 family transcriptional regulator [Roseburia sp.]
MISTKGRYALKVMVELAEHDAEEYIPLKGIAEKLNISQKYLESISTILSKGHMIEGVSGKKGGYRLKRKPEEYRVGDILRLTEERLHRYPAEDQEPCEKSDSCCFQSGRDWQI